MFVQVPVQDPGQTISRDRTRQVHPHSREGREKAEDKAKAEAKAEDKAKVGTINLGRDKAKGATRQFRKAAGKKIQAIKCL